MKGGLHVASNPDNKGDTILADVIFVLDRRPTGSSAPSYASIFEVRNTDSAVNCSLNDFVKVEALSRFKILKRERVDLHTFQTDSRKTFKLYLTFKRRRAMYTEMRDEGGVTSGMYANCKKNAILMFVISHCHPSIVIEGEINVRRTFYH